MAIDFSQPVRLPIVPGLEQRSTLREEDTRLVNCYAEKQPLTGGYQVKKRPGTLQFNDVITYSGHGDTPLGVHRQLIPGSFDFPVGNIYEVNAGNIYINNTLVGSFSSGIAATKKVFFCQLGGTAGQLALFNALETRVFNTSATLIGSPALTASIYIVGAVVLNGRAYYMDSMCNIYGSNLDDATVYDPLNVIVARMEAGTGIALAIHSNYMVAFKSSTIEFFYDAGNTVGSVLSPVQNAFQRIGCGFGSSVVDLDGILLWISSTDAGILRVSRMDNMQINTISTPVVERWLTYTLDASAYALKIDGHRFYVLTLTTNGVTLPSPLNTQGKMFTLVYDLDEDLWYQWSSSYRLSTATSASVHGPFGYSFSTTSGSGAYRRTLLQTTSNGALVEVASCEAYPTDNGIPPLVEIVTPNFDADTAKGKVCNRISFLTDKEPGSEMLIRCNDDDYDPQKWKSFRQVDLGIRDPYLIDEGSFVRRSYHMTHECPTPFRIRAIDLQLAEGGI